jgi:hypothetical protein
MKRFAEYLRIVATLMVAPGRLLTTQPALRPRQRMNLEDVGALEIVRA